MIKKKKFISNLLMLLVAGPIFMTPFQARADMSYTMTGYQSLGSLYASGEITGLLNSATVYGFCVNNSALLYENTAYSASLTPIGNNAGLLESAYLVATYVPTSGPLTDTNLGVELQWAMWMALGQAAPLTDPGVQSPTLAASYSSIYNQAQTSEAQAVNQYNLGNLSQYAGQYQKLSLVGSQDLILVPTPLPATVYLFGSGLLGLICIRRRIMQNSKA
jgi:hypothetical protein